MKWCIVNESPLIEASPPPREFAPPRAPTSDEADLIARCKRGDVDAFDGLVRLHQSRVYNIALRLIGDADLAQDCAQDAFIRAYQSIQSFREDCAFTTWLYRIVTNACLDELRKRKPADSLTPDQHDDIDPLERIADSRPNPEQTALQSERRRAVRRAILSLPEHHRRVLVLYDLQGLSYEETGEVLGLSVGTVKSRLNRARLALKEKLESVRELFEV